MPGSRLTVYVKGEMSRSDTESAAGRMSTITRCASREVITINWKCGVYTIEPLDAGTAPAEPVLRRQGRRASGTGQTPGSIILIEREIKDTGERASILGLPARHVLLRTKVEPQPGACSMQGRGDIEQDLWIADVAAPSCGPTLAQAFSHRSVPGCFDRYQVTDRGDPAVLSGLPLRSAMRYIRPSVARDMSKEHALAEGAAQKTPAPDFVMEIKELSTAALDASLFEAPANFKQVKSTIELRSCGGPAVP